MMVVELIIFTGFIVFFIGVLVGTGDTFIKLPEKKSKQFYNVRYTLCGKSYEYVDTLTAYSKNQAAEKIIKKYSKFGVQTLEVKLVEYE